MKKFLIALAAALAVALGGLAAAAADPGNGQGNGPPATNPGSPGDDCSHGNSDKPCKPDPQPEHGKECDDHGQARGNEDHCDEATVPDETTPEETTPEETTPEETTSTPTVPTVPESTPGPVTAPESEQSAPTSAASPTPPPTKTSPPTKRAATKVVKVQKRPKGIVIVTTADGKRHTAVMGSG